MTTIYQVSTPMPTDQFLRELKEKFVHYDFPNRAIKYTDGTTYQSILLFDLTANDKANLRHQFGPISINELTVTRKPYE